MITTLRTLRNALTVALTGALLLGAGSASADFHLVETSGGSFNQDGTSSSQAGAHPFLIDTTFQTSSSGILRPDAVINHVRAELPPGIIGNPTAAGTCGYEGFLGFKEGDFSALPQCPVASQVGIVALLAPFIFPDTVFDPGFPANRAPLVNLPPLPGTVATFGFQLAGQPIYLVPELRRSGSYGLTVKAIAPAQLNFYSKVITTFWGVPADPSHDAQRLCSGANFIFPLPGDWGCSSDADRLPFLSNPADCTAGALSTKISISSWEAPEDFKSGSFDHDTNGNPIAATGCNQVEFDPSIESRPTTNLADSPSGLDFNLHVPQNQDPDGFSTAHLKDVKVTLPAGMTVNPSSADGLAACSMDQFGVFPGGTHDGRPVTCPAASKIGTVSAHTPLLEDPVDGAVYLAKQNENPFNSLLALYIAIEDEDRGLLVKFAGEVKADPQTGQLTTVFEDDPQVPVEDLELHLKQGPRAPLKTPATCGSFTTTSNLTPWTSPEGADAAPSDSFQLSQGPGGAACLANEAAAPNTPSFSAGTVDPTAAVYTPFVLKLARADGSQQFKGIDTTLPPGLIGKLAGLTYCPDASLAAAEQKSGRSEQASPSCPATSEVGSVNVGAGAGSTPLHVGGKAYLSGPYKGAPLSLSIVTPAVAGPFDLGTVVVRTALDVNPASAQIHAVSDRMPTILKGIPLNLRSISLKMDRPDFTLNPTSCDPMSVTGSAVSIFDQAAALSSPFQVGDCARLGFKPKLALKLKGGTKRGDNPALTATVTYPKGTYANIASASVALPRSAFLDQSHIGTVCTRVQYAADTCPAKSVYGFARAFTPLLDKPLEGPVYLRSSDNELPDLVMALHGQIDVDLAGRIDSLRGGIRTTFDSVPDAPVSKFVLMMKGGKKGLLENSRDLCNSTPRATASFTAQNGKSALQRPALGNGCKGRPGKPKKKG